MRYGSGRAPGCKSAGYELFDFSCHVDGDFTVGAIPILRFPIGDPTVVWPVATSIVDPVNRQAGLPPVVVCPLKEDVDVAPSRINIESVVARMLRSRFVDTLDHTVPRSIERVLVEPVFFPPSVAIAGAAGDALGRQALSEVTRRDFTDDSARRAGDRNFDCFSHATIYGRSSWFGKCSCHFTLDARQTIVRSFRSFYRRDVLHLAGGGEDDLHREFALTW
jgi:hypothetical protein